MATKFEINLPDGNGGYTPGHPKTEVSQIEDATEFMRTLLMTAENAEGVRSQIGAGTGSGSGAAPTLGIGTVTTGAAGSNAAASITDNGNSSYQLNLTIPKGDTGAAGSAGSPPVVSSTITVSTLAAGSSATASWSGAGTSASPLKLSLGIPRGATGSPGTAGASGISGSSLAANGYTKFGNGLIIQWGTISEMKNGAAKTQTFATGFASACYSVCLVPHLANSSTVSTTYTGSVAIKSLSTTSFSFFYANGNAHPGFYIAVGK